MAIMAPSLRFRPIDDADVALEPRLGHGAAEVIVSGAKVQQETVNTDVVAQSLVTVRPRRPYSLDLHRCIPFRGRRNGARMRAKADKDSVVSISLSAQLANVQFTSFQAHLCESRIANMGIVCPDDGLRARARLLEDILQGVEHVPVTLVPRFVRAKIHGPIVAFGIGHQTGVLRCVEEVGAILACVLKFLLQEVDEDARYRPLA